MPKEGEFKGFQASLAAKERWDVIASEKSNGDLTLPTSKTHRPAPAQEHLFPSSDTHRIKHPAVGIKPDSEVNRVDVRQ
jgi:hypothetical protein